MAWVNAKPGTPGDAGNVLVPQFSELLDVGVAVILPEYFCTLDLF